jgi:formylglycine-generating enzyme required for sulfatase activity
VINVNWEDAVAYADWLSQQTGNAYRLPSEAEWEYAARAGSTTRYSWGDDSDQYGGGWANCNGCGSRWDNKQTAPVGSFGANGFGLSDMAGNVWEWIQDCWHESYRNAPLDGSAWLEDDKGDCSARVIRGGSWGSTLKFLRPAERHWGHPAKRNGTLGFRLAQDL